MIEAVLFAAGHPLGYDRIGQLLGLSPREARDKMHQTAEKYNAQGADKGIIMLAFDDCCQLCTKEEYSQFVKTALGIRRGGNLSNSSIETLAVIAYNQPVTRVYVDTVRGVDSSYAVNSLLERGLIEPRGRVDAPGRPMLFGTTPDFLRCFGLTSLEELPSVGDGISLLSALDNMTIDDIAGNDEESGTGESGQQ